LSTAGAAKPPATRVLRGAELHRVHGDGKAARWYGRRDATWRWDDPLGRFGVLYLGRSAVGPFAESLLRSPADRDVLWSRVQQKRRAAFRVAEPLQLAKLHGEGLAWFGVTANEIADDDYAVTQAIARRVHEESLLDGICYRSRFDNDELCVALFDRADAKLDLVSENDPIDKSWAGWILKRRGYRLVDL